MLVEIFIFFQVVVIGIFIAAFFTKQEILWAIMLVFAGMLMFTSFHIENYVYEWNATISAYDSVSETHSYPYLMGINMLFFALGLLLGMFDLFDKYGINILKKKNR